MGRGFQLILADGDPMERLSREHRTLLDKLDVTVASLDTDAPHGVRDVDGRLAAWLSEHDTHAVLVRPDFYVFGSASLGGASAGAAGRPPHPASPDIDTRYRRSTPDDATTQ